MWGPVGEQERKTRAKSVDSVAPQKLFITVTHMVLGPKVIITSPALIFLDRRTTFAPADHSLVSERLS